MIDKTRSAFEVLEKVPHNIYALLLIGIGAGLVAIGQRDSGTMIIGGGLLAFQRGQ